MLREILSNIPDPRGRNGRDYQLWSLLGLIIVGFLCGRKGLAAVHRMGRGMSREQRRSLGFGYHTPCLSTLTETMQLVDADVLSVALGQAVLLDGTVSRHIAIDGKTMCASKNGESKATHCVSAFCVSLQNVIDHTASVGKGFEIPDALALIDKLELKNKIVTGDALLCQKEICEKIIKKNGNYILPVKDNQKTLKEDIKTAFEMPIFPPKNVSGTGG
jgi:hypothetical protein